MCLAMFERAWIFALERSPRFFISSPITWKSSKTGLGSVSIQELPSGKQSTALRLARRDIELIGGYFHVVYEDAKEADLQDSVHEASLRDAEGDWMNKSSTLVDGPIFFGVNTSVGAGSDFEQWTLSEILDSVNSSICWLHRLSNLVSKTRFARQNREAQKFLLRDTEGRDSEEVTRNVMKNLEESYRRIIAHDATGIAEYLVDRLAKTMAIRHLRILSRRSQQRQRPIEPGRNREHYADQLHKTGPSEKHEGSSKNPETSPRHGLSLASIAGDRMPKGTQGTKSEAKVAVAKAYRNSATAPRVSGASAALEGKRYGGLLPPAPTKAKGELGYVCPYCCVILCDAQVDNPGSCE